MAGDEIEINISSTTGRLTADDMREAFAKINRLNKINRFDWQQEKTVEAIKGSFTDWEESYKKDTHWKQCIIQKPTHKLTLKRLVELREKHEKNI